MSTPDYKNQNVPHKDSNPLKILVAFLLMLGAMIVSTFSIGMKGFMDGSYTGAQQINDMMVLNLLSDLFT
ncbi:hypothetical protein KKF55_02380 [Patescibacteria group bacterium]|nr:hypothetical protein [Patescibacteria group bacterium]